MTGTSNRTPDSVGLLGSQRWPRKVGRMFIMQCGHVIGYFEIPEETPNPDWAWEQQGQRKREGASQNGRFFGFIPAAYTFIPVVPAPPDGK